MTDDMPELPVRHETRENALGEVLWEDVHGPYSAEDMIAYGRACFRAGMERAAVIAENSIWGAKDTRANIASAIRAEIEARPVD